LAFEVWHSKIGLAQGISFFFCRFPVVSAGFLARFCLAFLLGGSLGAIIITAEVFMPRLQLEGLAGS